MKIKKQVQKHKKVRHKKNRFQDYKNCFRSTQIERKITYLRNKAN